MQVWHLASLPNLKELLLNDPNWGASPIARLCNYATYAAVNLPNLRALDSQPLTSQTKAVAEATYLKKKMYYNMRINMLRRKAAALAQQAEQRLQVRCSTPSFVRTDPGQAGFALLHPALCTLQHEYKVNGS